MARFLSKDKLEGFEKYKYNSIDTSVLSKYVMHPFWDWCVQFCPMWVAPNLLTFAGFLLTVLNFLLFSYYDYGFNALTEENVTNDYIPNWVWAVSAVNLFVAYTLDGIDGKQARRTGSSGPLGELFDHGLDSYSAVLIPTCLYSIFGRDELSPKRFFFVIWNIFINFYLTHWEKYNTGVMFLPWGYDFTMIGSCILLLVTSVVGPGAWHASLPGGLTPGIVFEITLYLSAALTSQTVILWNIYKSYRDRTGKMRPFCEAIRPLVPLVLFFILSSVWVLYSPSDIINRGPRLFFYSYRHDILQYKLSFDRVPNERHPVRGAERSAGAVRAGDWRGAVLARVAHGGAAAARRSLRRLLPGAYILWHQSGTRNVRTLQNLVFPYKAKDKLSVMRLS